MRSGLAGVMAKDSVGGIAMGLPLASPTARDASLHAGVQARLAQQSSDCDHPLSASELTTRGRRSGLHGDGVVVHLPDNPHGRRAHRFMSRSLAHACASSASEGCMHRICRAHGQRVLVNMIAMNMVEMAVVQIIDIVYGTELPSIPEVGAVCGKPHVRIWAGGAR